MAGVPEMGADEFSVSLPVRQRVLPNAGSAGFNSEVGEEHHLAVVMTGRAGQVNAGEFLFSNRMVARAAAQGRTLARVPVVWVPLIVLTVESLLMFTFLTLVFWVAPPG